MRATGLGFFLSVLMLVACGGDDGGSPPVTTHPDEDSGTDEDECIDEDEDGAGDNCGVLDCDDDDPDVTDECYRCRPGEPSENCPCDEGTEPELCIPPEVGDQKEVNGMLLQCYEGAFYCREVPGVDEWLWSDCEGVFVPVIE